MVRILPTHKDAAGNLGRFKVLGEQLGVGWSVLFERGECFSGRRPLVRQSRGDLQQPAELLLVRLLI
jgi:hypothetical protein